MSIDSFEDYNSTIQLNIWISDGSMKDLITDRFENLQASSDGLPQFSASNDYFDIARVVIYC